MNGALPGKAPPGPAVMDLQIAFTNLTFQNPMGLKPVPGTNQLVVWGREGYLWLFDERPDATEKRLILDISNQCQGWGASGLLSVAFHPGFATNGWIFVYYTWVTPGSVQGSDAIEAPELYPGGYHDRLARFTYNGSEAPIESEVVLVDQVVDSLFHTGGDLFFHPKDGFLYWSNGDGETDSSQKIDMSLLSGLFRLDIDQRGGDISHPIGKQPKDATTGNYFIPNDNPFVGAFGALEEYYALGLRNPYRVSLDEKTQRIFIGDVGAISREEINVIEPTDAPGLNFQWNKVEGSGGSLTPPFIGVSKPPYLDYPRQDGGCIIGGYVYRGAEFPELYGRYIFGDNQTPSVWAMDESTVPPQKIRLADFPLGVGTPPSAQYLSLSSFGIDHQGEVYLCQLSTTEGRILKLARQSGPATNQVFPKLLSQTGIFADTAAMRVSSNMIPYDVNSPLWSDGAHKQRWFTIPKNTTIGFSKSGEWNFPAGSVFVKHFELAGADNGPARRLETRVLVRGVDEGTFGATYKWRADNSDAELVDAQFDETVTSGAGTQTWHYPGPAECLQCHTRASKGVLGMNTRQLNRDYQYSAEAADNEVKALNEIGVLYPAVPDAALAALPQLANVTNSAASLETRVRSYLDSNCSQCHRPGGVHAYWDARFDTPLELSGILNGVVSQNFDITGAKTIVPGHPEQSMIFHRADSVDPALKMPPLARSVIDADAVAVLDAYIRSLPETTNALPNGWTAIDIGTVTTPSTVVFSRNSLSINAGIGEIYGFDDSFVFVYHELDGDGEIIARIAASAGEVSARSGVMMRASLDPGSQHASSLLMNRRGLSFFRRSFPNGATDIGGIPGVTTPVWVSVKRQDNIFTESYSLDGTNWAVVDTATIDMPVRIYAGIAASGVESTGSYVIDNIQTINFHSLNEPPTVQLAAEIAGDSAAEGPIVLTATPSDSDGVPLMVEFYDGDTRLGQATSAPFELTVSVAAGQHAFSALAYDNFAATGASPATAVEARPITIHLLGGDGFQFSHNGNPGIAYVTEGSTDLVDWTTVSENTPTNGEVIVSLESTGDYKFFRVRPK